MSKKDVVNITNRKEEMTMTSYPNSSVAPVNTGYDSQGVMVQSYPYDYSRISNPTPALAMYIDVADLLRVHAQSMAIAYNLGANSNAVVPQSDSNSFSMSGFLGVYDDSAYGVYSSAERYESSRIYWHDDSLHKQVFLIYEDALGFARAGVALLNGLAEKDIPPMKVDCNWRQKIFDKPADG